MYPGAHIGRTRLQKSCKRMMSVTSKENGVVPARPKPPVSSLKCSSATLPWRYDVKRHGDRKSFYPKVASLDSHEFTCSSSWIENNYTNNCTVHKDTIVI